MTASFTRRTRLASAALMSTLSISSVAVGCGNTRTDTVSQTQKAACPTASTPETDRLVAQIPAKTTLSPAGRPARLNFNLPADAAQGPATWYVLRLSADLSMNPSQPNQTSAGIIGATNGRVSHQVELERRPEGIRLFWNGLLGGPHHEATTKPKATIKFDNYLQTTGVKPGKNTLELRIDQRGGNLVRQVTVRPGSGIYQASHPPEQLGLEAPQTVEATNGEELAVPYTLTRASNRAADTPTRINVTAQGLQIHGPSSHTLDCIGERTSRRFTLTGDPGNYIVRVSAAGDYNQATAIINVHIAVPASPSNKPRLIAAALLLLAAVGVARSGNIRRRLKKPQSQP